MNPEIITKIENRLTELEELLSTTNQAIRRVEIDNQTKLKANTKIAPGIGTKIAYDSNGLILKGSHLDPSDIPLLPIDSIDGLRSILDKKVSTDDINSISTEQNTSSKKDETVFETGIRINYNKDGLIVSSSELVENDIPKLPISHIDGLQDEIDIIKSNMSSPLEPSPDKVLVNPGTFTKITYNADGKVVHGSNLSIYDIPMELITRINLIEEMIPTFVQQRTIDGMRNTLNNKVDSNPNTNPAGTFTKVKVDEKGLVVSGDTITLKDLPEIKITDVVGLDSAIRSMAHQDDLVSLNESVSSMMTTMNSIGDVISIKNEVGTKASNKEVKEISHKVDSLQNLMDTLSTKIPNELILEQLQLIQSELSSISGRVSVLERKLNMEGDFDTDTE